MALLPLLLFAGSAAASPGAYKILMAHATSSPPERLAAEVKAFPDVASVEFFDAGAAAPTAAKLTEYDLVVVMSNFSFAEPATLGDALASYVDVGGVVIEYAYANWEAAFPAGRYKTGGYSPFIPGPNPNTAVTLGAFDAGSLLMQGVSGLASNFNTEPTLAPGAASIAKWNGGREAIALKGRVASVSAFVGDEVAPAGWSGNFGRLTVNAVRMFNRHTLTVANANPAGGTVTGSAGGISCGATCVAVFEGGAAVSLSAAANPGFVFAGFGGACAGIACSVTMSVDRTVSANFYSFGGGKKVKRNKKKGTATLSFEVGGPGQLVLSGKKVKKQSKAAAKAGRVSLPVKAKGKALKNLKATGKAKVQVQVAYTPTGGSTATFTKKIALKLASD